MITIEEKPLEGWGDDARKTIVENPDYFVWWYTVKSVGLGVVAAFAAFMVGREMGRRAVADASPKSTLTLEEAPPRRRQWQKRRLRSRSPRRPASAPESE